MQIIISSSNLSTANWPFSVLGRTTLDRQFRQISDIGYALLCITRRNRNERRLLGHINQLLKFTVEASNQVVGSSNLSGRANKNKELADFFS